ncbi:CitMHS family transporter [Pseudomonas typographi]|uniref:Citrate transporter n=1 Tax=Pseudomonas typographi TaxID=2715964 RepID=A0ABR7Z0K5_9PSED|nr:citrate:proton symporter [Pseudomonas typographi]MBD1552325.1 citrate transporter [Pseudomonas typographi]MBD1589285.1 citrate transporter [Pseudomonas typographi]MBD1598962.1 citrate transporter [Pseudomonas typographi]
MLALLGIATILSLTVLLLFDRLSVVVGLILIPTMFALLGGFGAQLGGFYEQGIKAVAPTAATFMFAILYFGVVTDAGLLKPIIDKVVRHVGHCPVRVCLGTAILCVLVHLDGAAAVCFLLTVKTMLPIYERLGLDRRILAGICGLAAGINILPWVAPVLRSSAVMHVSPGMIFQPLWVPAMVGLAYLLLMAGWLGRRERRRLGQLAVQPQVLLEEPEQNSETISRPQLFKVNALLTLVILVIIVLAVYPPIVVFMIGLALALLINYPAPTAQMERLIAHARPALIMASILLASGVFTGVLHGAGMLDAIAYTAADGVPNEFGRFLPLLVAVISAPLSLLFDPDSYYFGVLPVLAQVHQQLGGDPLDMARASLMGLHTVGATLSPNTPVTFLLTSLCGISIGQHQRFLWAWALGGSWVMTAAALLVGAFSV